MLKIYLILFFFLLPFSVYSQTADEIKKEANPEYVYKADNSEFAQLLGRLTEAKKSGDIQTFNTLLNELSSKYKNNKNVISNTSLPVNRNIFVPTMSKPEEVNVSPDWANGENLIYPGNVVGPTPGNPNPFNRKVKIEADTMGNLYAGFINFNMDTLYFYSSTNKGMNWTKIQAVWSGVTLRYQSFDFGVTDTTGGFKIGLVVSLIALGSSYQGDIYYADMLANGTSFISNLVQARQPGRGCIGPVICSDGYRWTPANTYWYIAYQNCDATTGETSLVPCAYTPNWGSTWVQDTARSTYNDYELDIDYNWNNSDSIYVLLTNNLTLTNENLRLRYIALTNWGTNVSWKQFNPASTAVPEYNACLAVNRPTNTMAVSYTVIESSNLNLRYSYAVNGYTWVTDNVLTAQTNNESRSYIQSLPQQTGAFRIAYISSGASFDSVIYANTFDITTGFANRTLVSRVNASTTILAPCVTGYMYGALAGAGVIYAGSGPSKIWFNGSDVLTEINNIGLLIPDKYSLSQNYPNPFNPVTKINFSIPKNNLVTLKVYNVLGKEVAVLVNETMNAGTYEVTLNASNLSSGVYFYKITSGDFMDTRKMMLIK